MTSCGSHAEVPISLVLGGGSLLYQVSRELGNTLERQLAPAGLTAQQAALLMNAAPGKSSPRDLMSALGTDTAGMTRLLDRLAAKGLIERRKHPEDRRSIVIELTAEGQALVPKLPRIFGGVVRNLLDAFSKEDIEQLSSMLQRLLGNLASGRMS